MNSLRPDRKECVLRALAATEIAETCPQADIRERFFSLAEHWLDLAQQEAQSFEGEPAVQ